MPTERACPNTSAYQHVFFSKQRAELIDLFCVSSVKGTPFFLAIFVQLLARYVDVGELSSYSSLSSSAWRGNSSLCLTSFGAPAKSPVRAHCTANSRSLEFVRRPASSRPSHIIIQPRESCGRYECGGRAAATGGRGRRYPAAAALRRRREQMDSNGQVFPQPTATAAAGAARANERAQQQVPHRRRNNNRTNRSSNSNSNLRTSHVYCLVSLAVAVLAVITSTAPPLHVLPLVGVGVTDVGDSGKNSQVSATAKGMEKEEEILIPRHRTLAGIAKISIHPRRIPTCSGPLPTSSPAAMVAMTSAIMASAVAVSALLSLVIWRACWDCREEGGMARV